MIAEVNTILSNFNSPLNNTEEINRFKLGESFTGNITVKKMISLVNKVNSAEFALSLKADVSIEETSTTPLSKNSKLYLFILLLNNYFDSEKNKFILGYDEKLKNVSHLLEIESNDYNSLVKFYYSNKLYIDTIDAAYLAFEQTSRLIRSKGINVYFINRNPGEVIYLKYLENYNIFLSKNFTTERSYNSLKEIINIKEINIIDEKNYDELNYETPTFKNLKAEIKKFNPLQRVEVSETSYNPRILLDPVKCLVTFSGASSPISTTTYFEPIFEWLNLFDMSGKKTLNVHFKFKYYNTYTSKFLVNFVWACNRICAKEKEVSYYWYHDIDDDEMREFGEYLQTQSTDPGKFYVLETY